MPCNHTVLLTESLLSHCHTHWVPVITLSYTLSPVITLSYSVSPVIILSYSLSPVITLSCNHVSYVLHSCTWQTRCQSVDLDTGVIQPDTITSAYLTSLQTNPLHPHSMESGLVWPYTEAPEDSVLFIVSVVSQVQDIYCTDCCVVINPFSAQYKMASWLLMAALSRLFSCLGDFTD